MHQCCGARGLAVELHQHGVVHANIGKRQIRSPKVYVRDTGLLHRLLGIDDQQALFGHPKLGASWEGFVIEQLLARTGIRDAWFWGTHGGAEIDLLLDDSIAGNISLPDLRSYAWALLIRREAELDNAAFVRFEVAPHGNDCSTDRYFEV